MSEIEAELLAAKLKQYPWDIFDFLGDRSIMDTFESIEANHVVSLVQALNSLDHSIAIAEAKISAARHKYLADAIRGQAVDRTEYLRITELDQAEITKMRALAAKAEDALYYHREVLAQWKAGTTDLRRSNRHPPC